MGRSLSAHVNAQSPAAWYFFIQKNPHLSPYGSLPLTRACGPRPPGRGPWAADHLGLSALLMRGRVAVPPDF